MKDGFGREIDYLRISVTDRCNLRCIYCMPEEGVAPVRHADVLTLEEIERICCCAAALGITKIKLTGGEPLVRRGLAELVQRIKLIEGIEQVTITSNGILLAEELPKLAAAGLDAVNISLDTCDKAIFEAITRRKGLSHVLVAIDNALTLGIQVKINCVPVYELNGGELAAMAELARTRPIDVRFIELMPIGYAKAFTPITSDAVYKSLEAAFGVLHPVQGLRGNGPAHYVKPTGFAGCIGFIDAISSCFCEQCNRIRITSTGFLKLCLHYNVGVDLRAELRAGITDATLIEKMRIAILQKPERQHFGEAILGEDACGMSQIGG